MFWTAVAKNGKGRRASGIEAGFRGSPGRNRESTGTRVKQAFEVAGEKAKGELCKGMQGIVAEGDEQIEKKTGDLGLIGAGERVEHYEMASYQCAISLAKQLGLNKAESLLSESLKEEENTAKLLSQLSK